MRHEVTSLLVVMVMHSTGVLRGLIVRLWDYYTATWKKNGIEELSNTNLLIRNQLIEMTIASR